LEAAARVFARDGLAGATTRAIARDAGVNEVTLFRLFKSKDRLLEAVVGQTFGPDAPDASPTLPPPTGDLRADLRALARIYESLLVRNLPLVRTMIGELHHRHHDQEKQVFRSIFLPVKQAVLQRFELAAQAGQLRAGCRPDILSDLLGGMIFTGVLRRANSQLRIDYGASTYLDAAIDLTLDGALTSSRR
jgi:AcrR family transcriptional regulator